MNEEITYQVLQECVNCGVREFIVCAGSRNSSFVEALRIERRLTTYYWPEERSGAFFALGRTRLTNRPVAIVTTSGTAAAEVLAATMEAHYSGIPLILITADRPDTFRGSGAPQSAEQVNLFGPYTKIALDVSEESPCDLNQWDRQGPLHINVCLAEPQKEPKFHGRSLAIGADRPMPVAKNFTAAHLQLNNFFSSVKTPLVIVSTLKPDDREAVAQFLLKLQIPVMLEAISGLREDPRLQALCLKRTDKILESAAENGYSIDGVLRIGGIPTHRIWRDLEYVQGRVNVCGLSEQPFSGLSWNRQMVQGPLTAMLKGYQPSITFGFGNDSASAWLTSQERFLESLQGLFDEEPASEPALLYALSKLIGQNAHIYLGNSLPIREWDMAAERQNKQWAITASRGVNGIDGQISTFLGLCRPQCENWGIFGDLTTLYDLAGCWILPQMDAPKVTIVVVNNGGGKIFERMYPYKEMLNLHQLSFKPLAEMWGLDYSRWEEIPEGSKKAARQLIEIIPDEAATQRFWQRYAKIDKKHEALQAG